MTTYIPPPRRVMPSKKRGIDRELYYVVFYNLAEGEKYVVLWDVGGHRLNFLNILNGNLVYDSSIKKEFQVVNCIDYITDKSKMILKKETLEKALQQYYKDAREGRGAIKSLTNVLGDKRGLVEVSDDGSLILSEPCVSLVDFGNALLRSGYLSAEVDRKISEINLPPKKSVRSMAEKIYEIVLSQE